MKRVLITGGAGFIGSNYVRHALSRHQSRRIINFDKLTYAGNLDNLRGIEEGERYSFIKGDVADADAVEAVFREGVEIVVNFAAETHVDRSIDDPSAFIKTDVFGAYVLLEAARRGGVEKFVQISTDEVYGSVQAGSSKETDPLMPRNPYSASKAGADRLAYSYFATYGLPALIIRTSNNYGPYQYPEKFIPLCITNAIEDRKLPVYGDGLYVRDWIHVEDHCRGIDLLIERGVAGEVYNLGGSCEKVNLDVVEMILDALGKPRSLIEFVPDRPGHDRRYSLDSSKIKALGYEHARSFEEGLKATVHWYIDNRWWWEKIKSGEFRKYYEKKYGRS